MARFRDEHPRGRYGGVLYSLGDLGLDRTEIGGRLSGYRQKFVAAAG